MADAAGEVWVSYNGEIYNYSDLRRQIERASGYVFRSDCDTELLPIGWKLWGNQLFDRLEGMFAIALWDTRTSSLILARDGIGIKPLYVAETQSAIYFGSEIKALLATGALRPVIGAEAFHTYLSTGYTAPGESLLEGVHQVPPGSILTIDRDGQRHTSRYWAPRRDPHIVDAGEALDGLRDVLDKVCAEMLAADVPVGLLQSSGVDSALLAYSVRGEIPSFTATFEEKSHNEAHAAERLAINAGHPWRAVPVDSHVGLSDVFRQVAIAVDGQLADSSCLAHYLLCGAVRREVTVALAGDGADEFFAGYPTYKASRVAGMLAPLVPNQAVQFAAGVLSSRFGADERRLPWHQVLGRFLQGMTAPTGTHHAEWRRLATAETLRDIAGTALEPILGKDPLESYRQPLREQGGRMLDRCLLADQKVYLPADMLMKVDRMSMAHSLEIRVPFLDRRVMDFAGKLHGNLLAGRTGHGKRILRQLIGKLGAGDEFTKGAKRGFNVPLARLLRHDLKVVGNRLLLETPEIFAPLLRPDALRRLWHEHLDGHRNHAYLLWSLLIFGTWREANL